MLIAKGISNNLMGGKTSPEAHSPAASRHPSSPGAVQQQPEAARIHCATMDSKRRSKDTARQPLGTGAPPREVLPPCRLQDNQIIICSE